MQAQAIHRLFPYSFLDLSRGRFESMVAAEADRLIHLFEFPRNQVLNRTQCACGSGNLIQDMEAVDIDR